MLALLLSSSMAMAQRRAKTPLKLLQIVYKLTEAKKYDKLKRFLYDGKVAEGDPDMNGKSMEDLILKGIQSQRKRGDFAYSAQGLKLIIDKHSDRLIPIPQKLRKRLFEGNREFAQFADLKLIAEQRPQDIYIFDYKGVHILMAKINRSFQLVFWEGLGNIIRDDHKSEPASTPAKKTDDGERK